MEALTAAVKAGKTRYIGFSEWSPKNIDDAIALTGRRAVRLQPAAVFPALAAAGEERHPALRRQWHFPDRLVAARPGGPHRQVRPRRAAADGHPARPATRWAAPIRGWLRPEVLEAVERLKPIAAEAGVSLSAVRPGLGAARAQRRLRHRRRQPPRPARRERGGRRGRSSIRPCSPRPRRSSAKFPPGRADGRHAIDQGRRAGRASSGPSRRTWRPPDAVCTAGAISPRDRSPAPC